VRRRGDRHHFHRAHYALFKLGMADNVRSGQRQVGTRYGRMSSQMAAFLDRTGGLWARGALNGKVGAAFTSTATQHGGQETTLFSIITNLLHFGMVIVGLPYSFGDQMRLDEVTGGSPYGATTIAAGDGSRQPGTTELDGARFQGRHVAEIANRLFGDRG